MRLLIILGIPILGGIIGYLLIYRIGHSFYRTGKIVVVISSSIVTFLIPFTDGASIIISIMFALLGLILAFIIWPLYYKQLQSTEWFREKMRQKYGKEHPWVIKATAFPDCDNRTTQTQTDTTSKEPDGLE